MRCVFPKRLSTRNLRFETCEQRQLLATWGQLVDFVGPQPWPPLEQPTGDSALVAETAPGDAGDPTNPTVAPATRPGAGQTIAIIDSGIAYDHEALGSGFGSGRRVVGGWDFAEGDADPYDDGPAGFHGTHVAGIAAGDSNQLTGVAPGADLVALRIYTDWGETRVEWLEGALRWVADHRVSFRNPITAVNLSLAASMAPDDRVRLDDELRDLRESGVFVAVSAGNAFSSGRASRELSYPASSEAVVPVASVDADGRLSNFSQRSERVLAAPGRLIRSAVPDYVLGADGNPNDYSAATGTSMAAPYVAGASVVVRQAWLAAGRPAPSVDQLEQLFRDTADTVHDAVTGLDVARVNLTRALASLTAAPTNTAPPTPAMPSIPASNANYLPITPIVVSANPVSPAANSGSGDLATDADACVVQSPKQGIPTPAASSTNTTAATSESSDPIAPVRAIDFLFRKLGRK